MAQVASSEEKRLSADDVWKIVFSGTLEQEYEAGKIATEQFYETFCRETQTRPDFDALSAAASEIFSLNVSMKPVLAALARAHHPLGLLSNTNEIHWRYVSSGRYSLIPEAFDVVALSFELGCVKPEPAIFRRAVELAGVQPEEIFYVDDTPEHVAAAKEIGIDGVVYTSTPLLVQELRARGIRLNY